MSKNRQHVAEFMDKIADGANTHKKDTYFSFKGVLYPTAICNPETFHALESFEARTDDVILAGYPKTGTNWLDHILSSLESAASKYTEEEMKQRIAVEKELALVPRLEFGDPEMFKRLKKFPYRRILLTHLRPHALPTSIFKNKAKVLVLIRNPKDTVVSYFHFSNKLFFLPTSTWDQFFTNFMNGKVGSGSYFDYVAEWDKYINDENIMAICYEELKENLNSGLKKIAEFLGFSLTEEEIQNVAEKSTFKAMKEKSSETHGSFGDTFFRKGHVCFLYGAQQRLSISCHSEYECLAWYQSAGMESLRCFYCSVSPLPLLGLLEPKVSVSNRWP